MKVKLPSPILLALLTSVSIASRDVEAAPVTPPPSPYGAVPTSQQVAQAEMGFYAFCHFTVDTITDREWGTGGESETVFNPTNFDADQIVKAVKASGAGGLILTCKHHDGFCLWPTATTEHNISNSPYKNGKGDIVREMSDACQRNGIKFGVYVSPWDRNNEKYGTPAYPTEVYHKQIEELTSQYGKIFEIWFDGANGGNGYYQGKVGLKESADVNNKRCIDAATYYDFPSIFAILKKNQPEAIIFSDLGPGVRWVSNEEGNAPDPCYATITYAKGDVLGHVSPTTLANGTRNGETWCQAEADVSIRPGWFWHQSQNSRVRSPENLMNLYMKTVGHGTTLNLNCPPDRRGVLHEKDVESLQKFGDHLRETFATNLAAGATPKASNIRGGDIQNYGPQKLLDPDPWSAWVTDDAVTTPEVVLELQGEKTFNLIRMREDIRLGLRVEEVAVDAWDNQSGTWKEIANAKSIGACHLWRVPKTTTGKVRVRVVKGAVCPALSDFGLYLEPDAEQWIQASGSISNVKPKNGWKVVSASYQAPGGDASFAIDGNPNTFWHTFGPDGERGLPQEIVVDMGRITLLKGFIYLPRQDGTPHGMVDRYSFYLSEDGQNWKLAEEGEFGNLRANPVEQTISFTPTKARFFKFVARHALELNHAVVAELGVIEAK